MATKLNAQQELFALNIARGMNQTDAYRAANYKSKGDALRKNAARLMTNDDVIERIHELAAEVKDESIADAKERQRFWTSTLRDAELEMKDRLKASELLGRAHADFVERNEVTLKGDIVVNLLDLPEPT